MRQHVFALLVITVGSVWVVNAQTPDERAAARSVLTKRGDAVIYIQGSTKLSVNMGGRGQTQSSDAPVQAMATVIDGTGLAVMSLSALEPGQIMNRIMASFGGGAMPKMDIASEPSSLRMRLADGQELPARIVLRDEDLDLVFLKPVDAPKAPLAFVDGPSAKPAQLDPLVLVTRLGESAGWKSAVAFGSIEAVVDKPRTAYVLSGIAAGGGMGTPVFDLTGRFVGLVVMRTGSSAGGTPAAPGMLGILTAIGGDSPFGMRPVIIPADDIRQVAKQAGEK